MELVVLLGLAVIVLAIIGVARAVYLRKSVTAEPHEWVPVLAHGDGVTYINLELVNRATLLPRDEETVAFATLSESDADYDNQLQELYAKAEDRAATWNATDRTLGS